MSSRFLGEIRGNTSLPLITVTKSLVLAELLWRMHCSKCKFLQASSKGAAASKMKKGEGDKVFFHGRASDEVKKALKY